MVFKDHLKYGAVSSACVTIAYAFVKSGYELPLTTKPDEAALVFVLCLAGSLAPDLDTHSKPSQWVAFFVTIFCAFSLYHREPYPPLIVATAFIFLKIFNHRGWIHTYTLPLALSVFGVLSGIWLLIPFSAGIVVHFKCDGMKFFQKSNWIKPIAIL